MIGIRRRFLALATLFAVLAGVSEAPAAASKRKRTTRAKRTAVRRPPAPPMLVLAEPASPEDAAVGDACRRGLGSLQGSAVAMDPLTGRVIAVVNPSLGIERAYQPCSVFKIVVAMAGLTEGVITPESQYNCRGGSCWLWPGHGPINLRRALAVSCNPYFEWVGEQIGYAKVQHYARLLGLGSPSGINLEQETARSAAALRAAVAGGARLQPREGRRHVRRAAGRAHLRHDQRRHHLPAPAGAGAGASCRVRAGGCRRRR